MASLPLKVVLPLPCKPAINMIVGFASLSKLASAPPINSVNSSFTIFTINWPGLIAVNTFSPIAFSLILSVNSFAIL